MKAWLAQSGHEAASHAPTSDQTGPIQLPSAGLKPWLSRRSLCCACREQAASYERALALNHSRYQCRSRCSSLHEEGNMNLKQLIKKLQVVCKKLIQY